ncbi:TylF/MycF/NovP-related O-methyltransferase [Brachyspira hyodysenteriae]|uniref:TylF/MycF/NovP-related O-methyltransferase n=1 Tax=Brachyspira hyodysenteriae TaxID=159 RepID=UPI00069A5D32|nr:TylF/MycF/NovP-related O-methyltransferase [Brachyspira hyodysenteriae]
MKERDFIDDIVFYIPFRRLRDAVRIYLRKKIEFQDAILEEKRKRMPFIAFQKKAEEETYEYLSPYLNDLTFFESYLEEMKYHLLNEIEIDGLFLEFGVYKGSSLNYISNILKDKTFYGFDSFEGFNENWTGTFGPIGTFDVAGNLPKVNDNVKLIKGWFNESLPPFLESHKEDVAFVHVDCDLYSSAKVVLDNLYPRIKKGTVIVFDEYINYPNWQNHEFKAFQEFVKERNVEYKYITVGRDTSVGLKIIDIK